MALHNRQSEQMSWRDKLWLKPRLRNKSLSICVRVRRANRRPAIRRRFDKCLESPRDTARIIQKATRPIEAQWIRVARGVENAAKTLEVDYALQMSIEVRHPEQEFVTGRSLIDSTINADRLFRTQGWVTEPGCHILEDAVPKAFEQRRGTKAVADVGS